MRLVLHKSLFLGQLLFLASFTYAQPQHKGMRHCGMENDCKKDSAKGACPNGEAKMGRFEIPNLTADQQKKMDEFKLKHMEVCTPLHNQLKEKEAHLQTLLTAAVVDNKDVEKTMQKLYKYFNRVRVKI